MLRAHGMALDDWSPEARKAAAEARTNHGTKNTKINTGASRKSAVTGASPGGKSGEAEHSRNTDHHDKLAAEAKEKGDHKAARAHRKKANTHRAAYMAALKR